MLLIVKDVMHGLENNLVKSPQSLEKKPVQESSNAGGVGNTVQEMSTCDVWDTSPELMEKSTANGLAHTVQEEKYR